MKYIEEIRAKFFTLLELSEAAKKRFVQGLTKKELEELVFCYNLLAHCILTTGRRLSIGKILKEDHPFDIFIIDEEIHKKTEKTKEFSLINPLPIQLKTIRKGKDNKVRIAVSEWFNLIQEQIDKVAVGVKIKPMGVLHLKSTQAVEDIGHELEKLLERLHFPVFYPYSQVVLSIEIEKENNSSETEILTWQLYPTFAPVACVSIDDSPRLREIYGL